MLKVLVICDSLGATQTISFGRPLATEINAGRLFLDMIACKANDDVGEVETRINLMRPDVVVFSRCTSSGVKGLVAAARSSGSAIIAHLDDDLLAVPADLGASKHARYNDPVRLAALRFTLDACDLVYASTPALADRLREHGVRRPIAAGEIYCPAVTTLAGQRRPATSPIIGYMATGGHGADLELVLPAIERLLHDMPDLRFETLGTISLPARLSAFGARAAHYPGVTDYEEFLHVLNNLGWWVGIAPLADTAFNRCKADTKWVEYASCGVPTVASDLPVYHKACAGGAGVLAGASEDWERHLRVLLADRSARDNMASLATDQLDRRYALSALTDQVLKTLNQAIRRSHRRSSRNKDEAAT